MEGDFFIVVEGSTRTLMIKLNSNREREGDVIIEFLAVRILIMFGKMG